MPSPSISLLARCSEKRVSLTDRTSTRSSLIDGVLGPLPLATGDLVRFGETLPQHRIRNGTRGKIEKCARGVAGAIRVAIRLEDGRLIEDAWSGFAQQRRRRHAGIPKIIHAVAGSAYSVQGRTALATVH